ncbi:MAG: HPr family phosphocarrier protein [Lachnospirales bacterium]
MVEKKLLMKSSLETNQVAKLVQNANNYKAELNISTMGKNANVKSIMGVISLGMLDGVEITISGKGDDEVEAIDFIYGFLSKLI